MIATRTSAGTRSSLRVLDRRTAWILTGTALPFTVTSPRARAGNWPSTRAQVDSLMMIGASKSFVMLSRRAARLTVSPTAVYSSR